MRPPPRTTAAALHEFIGKVAYRNELIFTIITVNDRDGWMGGFFLNMVRCSGCWGCRRRGRGMQARACSLGER